MELDQEQVIGRRAMRRQSLLVVALAVLGALYALQMASPLRINVDDAVVLTSAASLADGKGYLYHGERPVNPIGLPFFIAMMDRAGIANSATLVGLNLVSIALGMFGANVIMRRSFDLTRDARLLAIALALCSYVMIKHATLSTTDVPYFGISVLAMAALEVAFDSRGTQRWRFLALGVALAIAGYFVRRIGIILLAPALAAMVGPSFQRLEPRTRRFATISAVIIAALVAVVLVFKTQRAFDLRDLSNAQRTYGDVSPLGRIGLNATFRLIEWGELTVNTSVHKIPFALGWLIFAAAPVLLIPFTFGWRTKLRGRTMRPADLYLAAYIAVMLIWPFGDSRFWLPVSPLIAASVVCGISPLWHRSPTVRWLATAWAGVFAIVGMIAFAYSTRISLSGSRFPDVYGDGSLRATYQLALNGAPSRTREEIDNETLSLLRRFDRRARK